MNDSDTATAVTHHLICGKGVNQVHTHAHVRARERDFIYLLLLNCRGEWLRWSDGSGLSGERDRLARPWDRLEWSDVSECISEMSAERKFKAALV